MEEKEQRKNQLTQIQLENGHQNWGGGGAFVFATAGNHFPTLCAMLLASVISSLYCFCDDLLVADN